MNQGIKMYSKFDNVFFFTCTIVDWNIVFVEDVYSQVIVESLTYLSKERCDIYAFVIMPNHIHLLLSLKSEDKCIFQRDFLKFTSQQILKIFRTDANYRLNQYVSPYKSKKYQIWKSKPFWVEINDAKQFYIKLDYIHNNPMSGKWHLANSVLDYKWSSIRFHEGMQNEFAFLKSFECF